MAISSHESGKKHRTHLAHCPLALFTVDYAAVKVRLDELKTSDVTDFYQFFANHKDELRSIVSMIKIIDFNEPAGRLFSLGGDTAKSVRPNILFAEVADAEMTEQMTSLAGGNLTYVTVIEKISPEEGTIFLRVELNISPKYAACWSEASISFVDVGDFVYRERELVRAVNRHAVGRLTGAVIHNLNNMLTIVGGNLQLMIEMHGNKINADQCEMIDDAQCAAAEGAQLLSRLQEFSCLTASNCVETDVNDVIRDIVNLIARTKGDFIEVKTLLADNLGSVDADQSSLACVLLHLSLDAHEATSNGGTLTFATRRGQNEPGTSGDMQAALPTHSVVVEAVVTDSPAAQGAALNNTNTLFTSRNTNNAPGRGVCGVADLMAACGYEFQINSNAKMETTVTIYLPLYLVGEAEGGREKS